MRIRQRIITGLGITCAMLGVRSAHADLKMKWDCYLPNTNIDCTVLQNSLTSKIPFLKTVNSRKDADVGVTISSLPTENGTRFIFDFSGTLADGFATTVHTVDKIPSSIARATANVRLMTKLERGLDDFMDQKEAAEMKDGKLTLVLVDPANMPFAGRPEQNGMKWYVAPSVGTYFSDVVGVGINASGNGSFFFNYSQSRWRLQQWIGASYSQQSQPVPGTTDTATIHFAGGSVGSVFSRDLTRDHRWSMGLLLGSEKNPQANYAMRTNGSLGLEFDLIPRQTVNQRNLGLRCAIGMEFQRYDSINVEGLEQQVTGRQFCDFFVSWHFPPVDVGANLGETTVLKNFDYRSLAIGLSMVWRVTDNFTVSPWASLQQINKAINEAEPNTVVYADPKQEIEASMRTAVEQGYTAPFGIQSGLSVKYVFGNGSLSSEDQRWKTVSNLR